MKGQISSSAAELGARTTRFGKSGLELAAFGFPGFIAGQQVTSRLLGLDEEFVPPGANSLVPEQVTPITGGGEFDELASLLGSQTESGEINSPELENLLSLIQEERKPRLI